MTKKDKAVTIVNLIIATAVAGVIGLKVVHSFVYTRTEGEKLEHKVELTETRNIQRIEKVEQRVDTKFKQIISILKAQNH